MTAITIQLADLDHPAHAAAIPAIVNSYAMEPQGGGHSLPADVLEEMVPGLRRVPGHFTMLAWDGENPVGAAICFRGFSTFSSRPLVNVHDLAVLQSHRGRGIGSLLLSAVEEFARAEGCCKVTLEVREANPEAERLYRRLGYGNPSGFATRFLDKPLH